MRADLEAMFRAGVEACLPDRVLPPHLPEPPPGRTLCLAFGKAAAGMAEAVERAWHGPLEGLAVAPHGAKARLGRLDFVTAAHPLPDQASVAAAERLMALADKAGPDDLVLVLLSGGASSLACLPGEGLGLEDKSAIIAALLRAGAAIGEVNWVRRHLSRLKGGRLGAEAAPARLVTLAISDVAGDDPAAIGSGPTVGDPTMVAEAQAILARYGIPSPRRGWSETVKALRGTYRIVARNRDAVEAAAAEAERRGYRTVMLGDVAGEARAVGRAHAEIALRQSAGTALISGGELTVTVAGAGRGGPNQEYALAAALALGGGAGVSGLAADTDGIDGASEAAGAFFGGDADLSGAEAALAANDSGGWFAPRGALLVTGPTGTNVNDLRIIVTGR